MTRSFFRIEMSERGEVFLGNDPARGPWDPDACHAGPATALLARSCERVVSAHDHLYRSDNADPSDAPDRRLIRLTVDLARPIPIGGFRVDAKVQRAGRTTATSHAELIDLDGQVCATAWALHLTAGPEQDFPTPPIETPRLADAVEGGFPVQLMGHGRPGFSTGVETRYPPAQDHLPGPTTIWMRAIPVLDSEPPSPFQKICALADSGNAISRNAEPAEVAFVNPDLTITLHREPSGEWFGSDVVSHWQPNGIGMADALLFDEHGVVGRAIQTLLLRKAS
ncbi:MAG: thioesterase family protein [Acidimicrobiia bacterium]|nr:thioesterase family protein [Acidimicrobiia bacterium]